MPPPVHVPRASTRRSPPFASAAPAVVSSDPSASSAAAPAAAVLVRVVIALTLSVVRALLGAGEQTLSATTA
ncbi:hypothetical protein GCM10025868_32090 [Angustibacter aerolatus]|uniref:Uncharacterized protein n=1 Tax=Angustibacter aerolatus TaxID=1162965 RepID=A0ABQ6JJA9_9ACTN|nr:hypothetical protein GCM10025868_32090 [Angustibacter aerolatus]